MKFINREKEFLKKHIKDLKFKSTDCKNVNNTQNLAKNLNKICNLAGLNYLEKRYVFSNWLSHSKINIKVDELLTTIDNIDTDISSTDYFSTLKKLNYDYDRYSKYKNKFFYQELNYKKFVNSAMKHLEYELEQKEKQIINDIEYELGEYK